MPPALAALSERLDTDAPLAFARAICAAVEPYELGLAISIGRRNGHDGALLQKIALASGGTYTTAGD